MLGLGSIALLRQDYIEAKEYFGKAAAMNTASDKAMCGIAISCWIGGDKENGYACYKKALALNPLNITALYSLVRASYELDTLDEAARYLSSYLERNPVNLDVLFSLGGVCCKLGRGEMARSCAEKILALDPAHEGALAIMNVLNTKESACFDPATTEMHTKPAESGI